MFKIHNSCLLLLIVLVLGSNSLFAQNENNFEIRGQIMDSLAKLPLEGVTVMLTKKNGTVIKASETNEKGVFILTVAEKGTYVIHLSHIGYKNYTSYPLTISDTKIVNLDKIELVGELGKLREVVIKSRKTLIQIKEDKLIYNAAKDISNKVGSASDVLKKAPMITVAPTGEVKLRGNSNIKVLLNGLPSSILAKNLKEVLKTIPASSIQSIEVITSPSAKYEAEGAAGIINIITKKRSQGINGNIDLSLGNLNQYANGALNIAGNKFSFNALLNTSAEKERNTSELTRHSYLNSLETGTLFQRSDALQREKGVYGDFSTEYHIDSSQRLGAKVSLWKGKWPSQNVLYNLYSSNKGKNEYNQQSNQSNDSKNLDLSFNYNKKFRKPQQELQLIGQFSNSSEQSGYLTNQYHLSGQHYFQEQSPNQAKERDFSVQADYSHPLNSSGTSFLETGVRFSKNNSSSVYKVFNNISEPGSATLKEDLSRSEKMKYQQNVFAAYLNIKLQTKNNWVFRPGLRFESTDIGANFNISSSSFKVNFSNFVPSIMISKKLNDHHDLKLTYTERIHRPWIWDLNPYVNASDPQNLTYGNPRLRPELTRMFEAAHTYSSESGLTLTSSIYHNFNSNAIESLTTVDSIGISRTTSQNIAANRRLGTNINIYIPLNDNWTLNGGIELYHVWFKSKALNVQNNGRFYSFSVNSSYSLPNHYSLQASGDYGNGYITLQGKSSANYTYSFSVQKELFNNKASVTLNINNPFQKTFLQRSSSTASSFQSNISSRYLNRSFTIGFSWLFGSANSKLEPKPEPEDKFPADKPLRKTKRP